MRVFKRNLERAERKFDVMQALGAQLMLVCSNTLPTMLPDEERAADAAPCARRARRAAQPAHRLRGARLGPRTNLYPQAWAIVEARQSSAPGPDPRQLPHAVAARRPVRHRHDSRRQDLLHAAGRRAAAGDGRAAVGAPLPQLPGPGPVRPRELLRAGAASRATPARCRSRSSTTCSARRRTGAPPSTRCARCSISKGRCATGWRPRPHGRRRRRRARARARPHRAVRSAGGAVARPASRFSNSRSTRPSARALGRAARAARLPARRQASLQGRDAVPPGRHQPDPQRRSQFRSRATHFVEHGAVGLRDRLAHGRPGRARSIAQSRLQCARFDSRIGPNEARIPGDPRARRQRDLLRPGRTRRASGAVRNRLRPGRRQAAASAGTGLQSIDHVAFGLPPDQLDTWVLFCRAVLGMKPGESLELSDPFGLIRSCGIATDDRSVRFVLNVSLEPADAHRADGERQRRRRRASHRVRLRRHLRRRGEAARAAACAFVPISPNYYDDLVARLDIDSGLVERMRKLGILYDRNADRRILPRLRDELRRPLLLRDRAARRRLRRLWRAERAGADGLAGAGGVTRRSRIAVAASPTGLCGDQWHPAAVPRRGARAARSRLARARAGTASPIPTGRHRA